MCGAMVCDETETVTPSDGSFAKDTLTWTHALFYRTAAGASAGSMNSKRNCKPRDVLACRSDPAIGRWTA